MDYKTKKITLNELNDIILSYKGSIEKEKNTIYLEDIGVRINTITLSIESKVPWSNIGYTYTICSNVKNINSLQCVYFSIRFIIKYFEYIYISHI